MLNSYTQENPPKRGTAKKLWRVLHANDIEIEELHYNPNCWGNAAGGGWGTWAFTGYSKRFPIDKHGAHCGVYKGQVYIRGMTAPYAAIFLDGS